MKQKISLPYQIIMDRAWHYSFMGQVPIKEFRKLLNYIFRFGKENVNLILTEMKEKGLIEINKHAIRLKWYSKELNIGLVPKEIKPGLKSY